MAQREEKLISIRELWELFLNRRKLFIGSVLLALFSAFVYIAVTPPKYTREASILIKDNSKGQPNAINEFVNLNLLNTNTNIKNEIHVIQSPLLIETVIRRLRLDCNYRVKDRSVRMTDLYRNGAVTVSYDSIYDNASMSFVIELGENRAVTLSDFVVNGNKYKEEMTGVLSEQIKTPFGEITVLPNPDATDNHKILYFKKYSIKEAVKLYGSLLQVKQSSDDATIINLSVTDPVPQRADDFLGTLIGVYNENWIKDKNEISTGMSEFIDRQLKIIEQELVEVDKDISSYKSANLLPDIAAVATMNLSLLGANIEKQITLNNQRLMAGYVYSYIGDEANINKLLPANTGIDNINIESQIDRYNTLLLKKNNLISNSGQQNPLIIDMNQSLASMREMIIGSVREYLATLDIQIKTAQEEEDKTNRKIMAGPAQASRLLPIERDQTIKNALYLFLLQKRAESDLTKTFTAYNTRVIAPPGGSDFPTSPRRMLVIVMALLTGLAAAGLFVYLSENINSTIRNKEDLNTLAIPFAGEIPLFNKGKRKSGSKKRPYETSVVVQEKSRDIINEAFRTLRTNVDFMLGHNKGCKTLMTTSIHPESGKTFISVNLAASMALKGAKVVVLDIDLRRASLSSVADLPEYGLSDYLNGNITDIKNITVKSSGYDNLYIIPVGTIPPNPSELLLNGRLEKLIGDLRGEFDYIFCDSPPVGLVTDASLIGKLCDMTLFVIRAGMTDRRLLPDVEGFYKNKQFNNMSIVLNGLKSNVRTYGYGYGGYYK